MNNNDLKYLIDRLESVASMMDTSTHMAKAKLLSIISATKCLTRDIKGQDTRNVIYKNNPQEISIYRNEASGNLFFAKHCETSTNRVIPKRVKLDDRGVILVFN